MNNDGIDRYLLKERQKLPLDTKVTISLSRIKEWYNHWNGKVYVAFSGGKDSTVLLHLVRRLYPNVPAVFINTGLEYPEIVDFVKETPNVTIIRPTLSFYEVIRKHGYPVGSKKTAYQLRQLQNPHSKNVATRRLYLEGIKRDGTKTKHFKIAAKWHKFINSDIKVSEKCCDYLKKYPARDYNKRTKERAFVGILAQDSQARIATYLTTGCNNFKSRVGTSTPLAFWMEKDIWDYLRQNNIKYSSIYDKGMTRTGCMFCMFGVQLEKEPNRFQILKTIHPHLHKYCIDKLGIGKVLDFMGVEYE